MKPFSQTIVDNQGTLVYIVLYKRDSCSSTSAETIQHLLQVVSKKAITTGQISLSSLQN